MSARQGLTRTIHPRALAELGEEACIVALGVARDLRSGVIRNEQFHMRSVCATACCVAGWITLRIGIIDREARLCWYRDAEFYPSLRKLFDAREPSYPVLAADAIERYVYDGSQTPWRAT